MKIVITSEVYPPRAGGAGWSSRALALGLREAGHDVRVLTTSPGPDDLDGLPVARLRYQGRKRFAIPTAIARALDSAGADVVHAQHSLSALGALRGARAARTAVTVRDHWPVCFWSTRISQGALCPECGLVPMTRCVVGRVPAPGALAWSAIPYMRWDLAAKLRALGRAGASLAVSEAIGAELRAAGIPRVEVIPNVLHAGETRAVAEAPPSFDLPERFLLFVGKLEANKGAHQLVPALARAATGLPLVVLGEGTQVHGLKLQATRHEIPLLMRGWASREDVLRTMARATLLVFPSLWPEPLSRVLIEALALGTPTAAVATGGTEEILVDGESGLLVRDTEALGEAVARLAADAALRRRIGEGARERAAAFSPERLVPRYEAAYRRLV
jgi:glycosyltransferase involved in cell wall biosynthesis